MLDKLFYIGIFIGAICMIFFTPMKYTQGIYLLEYGTLTAKDRLLSFVPLVNIIKAENIYTGRVSNVGISTVLFILMTVLRVIVATFYTEHFSLQLITVFLFVMSILVMYIMNVCSVFIVLNDAGVGCLFSRILYSLVFPVGQYYIGAFVPTIVKNMEAEAKKEIEV